MYSTVNTRSSSITSEKRMEFTIINTTLLLFVIFRAGVFFICNSCVMLWNTLHLPFNSIDCHQVDKANLLHVIFLI